MGTRKIPVPLVPLHEAELKYFVYHLKRLTEEQVFNVDAVCRKFGLKEKHEFCKREIGLRYLREKNMLSEYDHEIFKKTKRQESSSLHLMN